MKRRLAILLTVLALSLVLVAPAAEAQQAFRGNITAQVTRTSTYFRAWFSSGKTWERFQPGCYIYMYRQGQYVYGANCSGWNNGSISYPASSSIPCGGLLAYFTGRNASGYAYSGWLNAC